MRKIDLANYNTGIKLPDDTEVIFETRARLVDILFIRPCGGKEILNRDRLATKITLWPDEELLLEEAEWKQLLDSIEACQFTNRGFVEFARRVVEAPSVDVKARQ